MKRILVVDDEINVAGAMHEGLRSLHDCEVFVAHGGHEAAFLMEKHPIDLLITDFRMPDMDGLTLAMRARELLPSLKIILISAFLDEGVTERARGVGVTQLLSKPVRTRDLRGMARQALALP
ncbi:MAG: response regulator [Anaerolineae bacterium]|nr:response regulator [Anaerolineae bacterium]